MGWASLEISKGSLRLPKTRRRASRIHKSRRSNSSSASGGLRRNLSEAPHWIAAGGSSSRTRLPAPGASMVRRNATRCLLFFMKGTRALKLRKGGQRKVILPPLGNTETPESESTPDVELVYSKSHGETGKKRKLAKIQPNGSQEKGYLPTPVKGKQR